MKPGMTTVESALRELDAHLTLGSYVDGHSVSAADIIIWGALRGNKMAYSMIKRSKNNVSRWFCLVESGNPWIMTALANINAITHQKRFMASVEGGSCDIGLGPVDSGVVTRFPPEPSGFLHIGHAKAALLNEFFAHGKGDGTLICRFDDTDPSKESREFGDSITADLEMMEIHFDKVSHSSDFFPQMYGYCVQLLRDGKAYADDTEKSVMNDERKYGKKANVGEQVRWRTSLVLRQCEQDLMRMFDGASARKYPLTMLTKPSETLSSIAVICSLITGLAVLGKSILPTIPVPLYWIPSRV